LGKDDSVDPGRRAHYGDFYGGVHDEPVAVVWGNCQAEAVRVLLAGSPSFPLKTVRVPPVHELAASDLDPLRRLLAHTALVMSQPVCAGYRNLPLGTAEVAAALPPPAKVLRWPVVRYIGLYPFSAIIRHPGDPSLDPPVVPYHDLRTLSLAAGHRAPGPQDPEVYRSIAASSVAELASRERGGTDVVVSDLLTPFGSETAHTLNHPGNRLLIALVHRLQTALGLPADASDPGRTLLGAIRAPLEAPVVAALGLDASPREDWTLDGRCVPAEEVKESHIRWYRDNPTCLDEGLRRHAERLALLGL
jgi:hypothetical protein